METARIPCQVGRGMFNSERVVKLTLADGHSVSAVIDQDDVWVEEEPTRGGAWINGHVAGWIVDRDPEVTLVQLSQPIVDGSTSIRVPTSSLVNE